MSVSWFDRVMGVDAENVARADEADTKLKAVNEDLAIRGLIPEQQALDSNARIDENSIPSMLADPRTSVLGGFQEGLTQGADSIRKTVSGTINSTLGTALRLIPWQVWVGVGLFLLWQFSPFLKRK